jgi:hypothetical protein
MPDVLALVLVTAGDGCDPSAHIRPRCHGLSVRDDTEGSQHS